MKQLFKSMQVSILLIIVASLGACTKERSVVHQPITDKYLNVPLKDYLKGADVDSAFALWTIGGTYNRVQLEVKNDTLRSKLSSFTTGAGQLQIQIFSKKQLQNKSLQFERLSEFNLQNNIEVNIPGPTGFTDINWKPRIIFFYQSQSNVNVTAIVAIRPEDPFFELKNIHPLYRHRIVIERNYLKTGNPNIKVGWGEWDCQSNCLDANGNYKNSTYFDFLPHQINNRTWDRVEFLVRFYRDTHNSGELNFDYNF